MSSPGSEMSKLLSILQSDFGEPLLDALDEKDFSYFYQTCKQYGLQQEDAPLRELTYRKKASKLLSYVLNPTSDNLIRMNALLAEEKTAGKSIILTRVYGKEFYYSTRQNQTLVRPNRSWTYPISPLEAAFKCGDFHLVGRLLARIPENQKREALVQLQKAKAECAPNIPGSYLYDLTRLSTAYEEYLRPYDNLVNTQNWNELDRLWGCIGEAQKNLSWFLLQVFCNPVPHHPLPNFNLEPRRDCLLRYNTNLVLDSIGFNSCTFSGMARYGRPLISFLALFKGATVGGPLTCVGMVFVLPNAARADLLALNSLCGVIQANLDQTIASLQTDVNALAVKTDFDWPKKPKPEKKQQEVKPAPSNVSSSASSSSINALNESAARLQSLGSTLMGLQRNPLSDQQQGVRIAPTANEQVRHGADHSMNAEEQLPKFGEKRGRTDGNEDDNNEDENSNKKKKHRPGHG